MTQIICVFYALTVNPEHFKIVDGKLYLFFDRFFINTLKKWDTLAKEKTETSLIAKSDSQWEKMTGKTASQ